MANSIRFGSNPQNFTRPACHAGAKRSTSVQVIEFLPPPVRPAMKTCCPSIGMYHMRPSRSRAIGTAFSRARRLALSSRASNALVIGQLLEIIGGRHGCLTRPDTDIAALCHVEIDDRHPKRQGEGISTLVVVVEGLPLDKSHFCRPGIPVTTYIDELWVNHFCSLIDVPALQTVFP